ncbi:MAG: hypothetical protein ACREBV_02810, partial [Candidatus Zixiibacteriota bacterium]
MEENLTKVESTARRFLSTGKVNGIDAAELANACSQIIRQQSEVSLSRALSSARRFARLSKGQDASIQYTALRALARVNHLISSYSEAKKVYLQARLLA